MVAVLPSAIALLAAAAVKATVGATLLSPEVEVHEETPPRIPPDLPYYLNGQPENWQVRVGRFCKEAFVSDQHHLFNTRRKINVGFVPVRRKA